MIDTQLKLLKFTGKTFNYYKNRVAGNKEITYDQAQRKMTRNAILAKKANSTEYESKLYMYGSLWFLVTDDDRIVWMRNNCFKPQGWNIDKETYIKLCKELSITS